MGALINTTGTLILKTHFNQTLFTNRLSTLRNDPPSNDPAGDHRPIKNYFNDAAYSLHHITRTLQHGSSGDPQHRIFLPDQPYRINGNVTPCGTLERRWLYFLDTNNPNVLTQANADLLKATIYTGLNDPSYVYLQVDCVDAADGPQTVTSADQIDSQNRKYLMIVLTTSPMDPNIPVPHC